MAANEPDPVANLPPVVPAHIETGEQRQPVQQRDSGHHPLIAFVGLLGYGRRGTLRRKHLTTLCFKILLGLLQIVSIAVLSAIAIRTQSPIDPTLNEWDACSRPLGPWLMVWLVRVTIGLCMTIYGFTLIRPGLDEYNYDPEHGENTDAVQENQTPPPVGPLNGPGQPQFIHAGRIRPHPRALQSLTSILSFLSVVWFIASHILVYTSLDTCRNASPHLWWLAFGILCIGYVIIAEIILVVLFIFCFVPVLLVTVNLLLLCLGRRPLYRPGGINHEIGKLPQQIIDRIPLVLYIPPPPPIKDGKEADDIHTYPPQPPPESYVDPVSGTGQKPAKETRHRRRHRFMFFRKKEDEVPAPKAKKKGPVDEWEANWEQGDYPFVRLPDNRATCAICLLDFEEPPRKDQGQSSTAEIASNVAKSQPSSSGKAVEHKVPVEPLALQDVGEGATPLRLLACGHCFHKQCIDPWLSDVSGRCPVCQKPVDIEELERLSKNGSTTAWINNVIASPSGTPPAAPIRGPEQGGTVDLQQPP
ncbi:SubName: Full=Uncharacterized protein {ECO:0000313/EMBL:CCA67513.1} [Serendipita indica DSM 11827]|uniref:RING-type domain-containing protein n=1 Tax=Serendipita indica (strain DSM 11827) TaxID=1109443 RepID=G4T889_SERID|nr:SubName: Full=Uncharacterized protein {ECO:0000313/EMBL:CCA67513.1} [Serendipita indica DSM 11827]CCA67513.1 hypothetical protein PIIN_01342 [Serendipita indica DSM 11827]